MRKIMFSLIALCCAINLSAQTVKLYKGETLVTSYSANDVDKVVFEGVTKVSSITLDRSSVTMYKGNTTPLTATVLPQEAGDKSLTWSSSDASVATVANGVVTAVEIGTTTITVTANDGSGVTATCAITVAGDPSNSHEYVDLGLPSGTLWATCNVGADKPEDYGDYCSWGEVDVTPKESYTSDNYIYYKEGTEDEDGFTKTYKGYTKYVQQSDANNNGYKGFYDNITILLPENDLAHVRWGGAWRIPTHEEFKELLNSCTWESCTYKGVNGYKVTGPNDKWIFLPCNGSFGTGHLSSTGREGSYWTSTLYKDRSDKAYMLSCDNYYGNKPYISVYGYRDSGAGVRPVCK